MRIADIKYNDIVDGEGVCLSVWTQGCPHRCLGCHNPETWDFNGGYEIDKDKAIEDILKNINVNGIQRNLSILGGEPLCDANINFTVKLLAKAKEKYPTIKTFVWTGYTIDELKNMYPLLILRNVDILIEGRYIQEQRDITLELRGSRNQRILKRGTDF